MKKKQGEFLGFAVLLIAVLLTMPGCSPETSLSKAVLNVDPGFPSETLLADYGVPGMVLPSGTDNVGHTIRSGLVDVLTISFNGSEASDGAVRDWFTANGWEKDTGITARISSATNLIPGFFGGSYGLFLTREGFSVQYTRIKSSNYCTINITRK